jgi:hypothetical protein
MTRPAPPAQATGAPDPRELRDNAVGASPARTRAPRHARHHPAAHLHHTRPKLCPAAAAPRTRRRRIPGASPQTETIAITQGQLPHSAESPPVAPIADYFAAARFISRVDSSTQIIVFGAAETAMPASRGRRRAAVRAAAMARNGHALQHAVFTRESSPLKGSLDCHRHQPATSCGHQPVPAP